MSDAKIKIARTVAAPPATGRIRTMLTADGVADLRGRIAVDATFRARWQTAVSQFEEAGGNWANLNTSNPNPGSIWMAAFLACVRRSDDDLGLTWADSWTTYRDTVANAAVLWAGQAADHEWKRAAAAIVYGLLYDDLDSTEQATITTYVSASATSLSYCLGNWDDQTASDHVAKVICGLAADDADDRFDDLLENTQQWADSRKFIAYQSLGYEWKGAYPTNWGQSFCLWMLKNHGGLTDADTTDKHLYHLQHAWMLLREFVIPHPGMANPYQAKTNMLAPIERYYTQLQVGAQMLWGRALLPNRLNLSLASDERGYSSHPLSDQSTIVASEDSYWNYWRDYFNALSNRFHNVYNFKWAGTDSATQTQGNIHTIGAIVPWLVLNVQLPTTAQTASAVGTPLVRRWWPGTLDLTTVRSGRTIANSQDSLITYTHQQYYINGYEGNCSDNGSWQVHRAGPLLLHRGSASHGPLSRKWTEAANGTVSFIDDNLYAQFYRANTDDFDAGGCRSASNYETSADVVADSAVTNMGSVTAWSADSYATAISSNLTRSYNSTLIKKNTAVGNEEKISNFTREWICVRRSADGTTHERVFTYDRITLADTRFRPWYNLCPATNPDIDGTETQREPFGPNAVPPGTPGVSLLPWNADSPTWWNYTGATRLMYANTSEPVGGEHTAVGSGKVCVTWLQPSSPSVKKMGGTAAYVTTGANAADGGPGIGHWNQWAELDGEWDDVSTTDKRAYTGLYTVSVGPGTVTSADQRFLMVCDVMPSSDSPATAAELTCDATSVAARCGASAVCVGKDGTRNSGSVTIPSGVTLVVFTNFSFGSARTLTAGAGLTITSANRTATSGGMLTVTVSGAGTLTFS